MNSTEITANVPHYAQAEAISNTHGDYHDVTVAPTQRAHLEIWSTEPMPTTDQNDGGVDEYVFHFR